MSGAGEPTAKILAGEVVGPPNPYPPLVIPPGTSPWVADVLRRAHANLPRMNRERILRERAEARMAETRRLQDLEEERLYRLGALPRMYPEALERIRRRVEAKSTGTAGEPTGGRRRKQKTRKARKARKTRKQKPRKK